MKTVLITGASSGIGLATARKFAQEEWNVAATMRDPNAGKDLDQDERITVLPLDVTNTESIQRAVQTALDRFGRIDILINNAATVAPGILEAATPEQIQTIFQTNIIGVIHMTRALLPHFRANHSGTIINISSLGGLMTFPMSSLYHASKWALEGFSEAMTFELAPLGIIVKIIEPGVVTTNFGKNAKTQELDETLQDYEKILAKSSASRGETIDPGSPPEFTAGVIFDAATDGTDQLRYAAGADAEGLIGYRNKVGAEAYIKRMRERWFG